MARPRRFASGSPNSPPPRSSRSRLRRRLFSRALRRDKLLRDARAGALAPQSRNLWFVAPGDCKTGVAVKSLEWRGEQIALDLAAGERAELPLLAPPKGKARLWLAESAQGRVGLIAGAGMAVSRDATLALAGDAPPRLWNASGAGPLRLEPAGDRRRCGAARRKAARCFAR